MCPCTIWSAHPVRGHPPPASGKTAGQGHHHPTLHRAYLRERARLDRRSLSTPGLNAKDTVSFGYLSNHPTASGHNLAAIHHLSRVCRQTGQDSGLLFDCVQMVMGWNVQDGFSHLPGTLVGTARKLEFPRGSLQPLYVAAGFLKEAPPQAEVEAASLFKG